MKISIAGFDLELNKKEQDQYNKLKIASVPDAMIYRRIKESRYDRPTIKINGEACGLNDDPECLTCGS